MQHLLLDFNRCDAFGRVRIGPHAAKRHPQLQDGRLPAGSRVLVVDADGNQCEGTLLKTLADGYAVAMDWPTWRDGPPLPPEQDDPVAREVAGLEGTVPGGYTVSRQRQPRKEPSR